MPESSDIGSARREMRTLLLVVMLNPRAQSKRRRRTRLGILDSVRRQVYLHPYPMERMLRNQV
jgi:hypothetical protein